LSPDPSKISGSWAPGADRPTLQLFAHALGNVAKLPVLIVLSGTHFVADVTLGIGEVVHDYLAKGRGGRLSGFAPQSDKKVSRETFSSDCRG